MMTGYRDFREQVIQKYHAEYSCGKQMTAKEIGKEFDLSIGEDGYDELVRQNKLAEKKGQSFDPAKSACDQMDMQI